MSLTYATLTGADVAPVLDDLAALRIAVFRDWPYLYDGDLAYERRYLQGFARSPGAVVVTARQGAQMVGASTGSPMEDHAGDFGAAFASTGLALDQIFYCAESVMLPAARGQGAGRRFFDAREGQARALGRRYVAFCSVVRPADHPARPADYLPLNDFWGRLGYAPLPGAVAQFDWKDLGDSAETPKPLQVWIKELA